MDRLSQLFRFVSWINLSRFDYPVRVSLDTDTVSNSYHYGFWDSMKLAYQEDRERNRLWRD